MSALSITHTFFPGRFALASEVNQDFMDITTWASGNITNDNFGILEDLVEFSIIGSNSTLIIDNAGNDGSIAVLNTSPLGLGAAVLNITSPIDQTDGLALLYINAAAAGNTIPSLRVDYGGDAVFTLFKDSFNLPQRTTTEESAISTPIEGSLLYLKQVIPSQKEGPRIYSEGAWSSLGVSTGSMLQFAGNTAPTGFLICDGSSVSQESYPKLYEALADTWGVTTPGNFKLPDMRRSVPIGQGGTVVNVQSPANTIGSTGGHQNLQTHGHTKSMAVANDHSHDLTPGSPGSSGVGDYGGAPGVPFRVNTAARAALGPSSPQHDGTTTTDGDHTHSMSIAAGGTGNGGNYPPAATMNYIVKW